MKFIKISLLIILVQFIFSIKYYAIGQSSIQRSYEIKPFEVTILSSSYMFRSPMIILSDKQLEIFFKGSIAGEKDSLLFLKYLKPSDTLLQISLLNLNKVDNYYSNFCIDDSLQMYITLKFDTTTKHVCINNYYHNDIGLIIGFVNSLIPKKYRIWYDKEKLIADYNKCKEIKLN